MKIHYNVTGAQRKSLVGAISQILNTPTKYLGAPTFAYEIGGYHIDKNGMVTGKENLDLEDALRSKGFSAEKREFDGVLGEEAEDCLETVTYQAERSAPDVPDRMEVLADTTDSFVVEIPKNELTDMQVQNLLKLVESKRTLLTKALGRPITVNDKGEILEFIYPYSEEAGVGIIYSQLSAAFVNHINKHQRITAVEREAQNEKFAMRTFLVRLRMNGGEFSAARKWLCRNLTGSSAFRTPAEEEKHKARLLAKKSKKGDGDVC
jgi:hypothetical protein